MNSFVIDQNKQLIIEKTDVILDQIQCSVLGKAYLRSVIINSFLEQYSSFKSLVSNRVSGSIYEIMSKKLDCTENTVRIRIQKYINEIDVENFKKLGLSGKPSSAEFIHTVVAKVNEEINITKKNGHWV